MSDKVKVTIDSDTMAMMTGGAIITALCEVAALAKYWMNSCQELAEPAKFESLIEIHKVWKQVGIPNAQGNFVAQVSTVAIEVIEDASIQYLDTPDEIVRRLEAKAIEQVT